MLLVLVCHVDGAHHHIYGVTSMNTLALRKIVRIRAFARILGEFIENASLFSEILILRILKMN